MTNTITRNSQTQTKSTAYIASYKSSSLPQTNTKIGYFIPEFPGQTHIFLWREYQALMELGMNAELISSRKPNKNVMSHSWSQEAENLTTYLFPLNLQDIIDAALVLLKAGAAKWLKCIKIALQAQNMSLKQKLYLIGLIPFSAKLVRCANKQGWSHIHVTMCGAIADIALFASVLGDLTYSLSQLGPKLTSYGPNQEQKWKYASFGIFQSHKLYQEAQVELAQYLPNDVVVAPVGVNLDAIKRQTPYTPWNGIEPCKIYTCGRLNPVKGHIYVIEAIKILRERGFDVRLQISGEDEKGGCGYRKIIEQCIQDNSLAEYVELLGAVSEERNRQAYEEAHIYAMGSLNETAGAVATMEAMAMEMPVVMTNVGATSELIDDGVDGLLVAAQSSQEIADAIARLLSDTELAVNLGKNARRKISAKFHHRLSAASIKKLADTLLQRSKSKKLSSSQAFEKQLS